MVYDKIDNIETYKGLSEDIYEGLNFLKNTTPDLACGVHEINPRVKAIVSEYETKNVNENCYEAHRKFIDIHYVLLGEEIIAYKPVDCLYETKAYDNDGDYSLFSSTSPGCDLIIGNGFFLLLYPNDGHMPQLCLDVPMKIKKVTLKVRLNQ